MFRFKTLAQSGLTILERVTRLPRRGSRRGSTLLVVMALMGLLTVLGVMFFSFATQEQTNAENFSTVGPGPSDDVDYFSFALEQLIVGPERRYKNSALWGGRWSLMPNAYGFDSHPYTGSGVHVTQDYTGAQGPDPFIDMNHNGTSTDEDGAPIDTQYLLAINDSPAAARRIEKRIDLLPAPDVGYTYPDANNPFLAYDGYTLDPFNGGKLRVVKPSFWVPQLLQREETDDNTDSVVDPEEDFNGNGIHDVGDAMLDHRWFRRSFARERIFRPHPEHVDAKTGVKRFLDESDPTDLAIILANNISGGFPFDGPVDPSSGTLEPIQNGVWQRTGLAGDPWVPDDTYNFDVDNDLDGIREGILMDLDFPPQERPSDGKLYVPIFSMTVMDADGLFNLNMHGNMSGDTRPPGFTASGEFGDTRPLSRSNDGLSPAEINPLWGLDGEPGYEGIRTSVDGFNDYLNYYNRDPANRTELANMEYWWGSKGRLDYTGGGSQPEVKPGRWGDAERVLNVWRESSGSAPISLNVPGNSYLFPFPGVWNEDDNQNQYAGGGQYIDPVSGSVVNANIVNRFGAQTHAAVSPLSFDGRGFHYQILNAGGTLLSYPKRLDLIRANPGGVNNPSTWLRYRDYGLAADVRWRTLPANAGPSLMPGTPRTGVLFIDSSNELYNDPLELTLEEDYRIRDDDPFPVEDIAGLHLSANDLASKGLIARASEVFPNSLNPTNTDPSAVERRKRFTTESWDRKQFGMPLPFGMGTDGAPGVGGVDDDGNGFVDDLGELGWPPSVAPPRSDDNRWWEFSADVDEDGLREFPPEFGLPVGEERPPFDGYYEYLRTDGANPAMAYYGFHEKRPWNSGAGGYGPFSPFGIICEDPFRPQLRRLLEIEMGNRDELKLQFRFSVNEIIDVERRPDTAAHPYTGDLTFRALTPHADANQAANVNNIRVVAPGEQLPTFPPRAGGGHNEHEAQEFWARYDRQRMARDIYVMLYALCGGDDSQNYLDDNSAGAVYTQRQTREMAQFAVNMVDSMDRDNVITIFEYDENLADGWNLDDQAYTDEGNSPVRATVAGVESQQLTFSESLWVFQRKLTNDNTYTPFDEVNPPTSVPPPAEEGFHFFFTELRNANVEAVDLAAQGVDSDATPDYASWRLRWQDTTDAATIRRIETSNNLPSGNGFRFTTDGATVETISAGERFTIASSNWTAADSSDLFADFNSNPDHERVAPRSSSPNVTGSSSAPNNPTGLTPNCDLDLVHTAGTNLVRFKLVNGGAGDFLSHNFVPSGSGATLVLERRANPTLPQLSPVENPWVVVDHMPVRRRQLITDDSMAATQQDTIDALEMATSLQRREPLNGHRDGVTTHADDFSTNSTTEIANSLNVNNQYDTAVSSFRRYQPHFDRDFASAGELLMIPLYGPKSVTRSIRASQLPPEIQHTNLSGFPAIAAAKFMHSTDTTNPNHWHRLLSFVEVPTRTHRQLGSPFITARVPGRINPNTIRHPEVLAGLIDDELLYTAPERDVNGDGIANDGTGGTPFEDFDGDGVFDHGLPGRDLGDAIATAASLPTPSNDNTRDWWFDFLATRDGVDPITGLILPGLSVASPFRDPALAYSDITQGISSQQDTILRDLVLASGTAQQRNMFELGTETEHQNAGSGQDPGANDVDVAARHQILSKLMNNVTTRSNVFIVFMSVQFHEAYKDPGTQGIRIGGRIDLDEDGISDDGERGFFVIDRSDAEKAFDPKTGRFDWKKLVKHRVDIN